MTRPKSEKCDKYSLWKTENKKICGKPFFLLREWGNTFFCLSVFSFPWCRDSRSFQPAKEEERVPQIPVYTPAQTSRGISCQWPWPHTSSPPWPSREGKQHRGTFQISLHTTFLFYQLSVFTLDWFLTNGWFFSLWVCYLLNVSQSLLVSLMKNSRSNCGGPIVLKTGLFWLELESVLWRRRWLMSVNTIGFYYICSHISSRNLFFPSQKLYN